MVILCFWTKTREFVPSEAYDLTHSCTHNFKHSKLGVRYTKLPMVNVITVYLAAVIKKPGSYSTT